MLSKKIAQRIVDEVMKVISNNVNVMNQAGVIIGSGDKKRIGTLHAGAVEAINKKENIEICSSTNGYGYTGVNEPIMIEGEVIGVVGITGPVDEVRPLSKLVKATARLLIEQEKYLNYHNEIERNLNEFLYELVYRKKEYDASFLSRAKGLGIDLHDKYRALVLMKKENESFNIKYIESYSNNIPALKLDEVRWVLFVNRNTDTKEFVDYLIRNNGVDKIGLGNYEKLFNLSFEKAIQAIEIGSKISNNKKLFNFCDWSLLINIDHPNKYDIVKKIEALQEHSDVDFIETMEVYIENNGEINKTAGQLNIHRNTLAYRLDKIHKITGKDPKSLLGLFELLLGIIWK